MNEYILMLIWVLLIVIESGLHWYVIEVMRESPSHKAAAFYRPLMGAVFVWQLMAVGMMWYWAAAFIAWSHLLLFPEILNLLRDGKYLGYLDVHPDNDEVEDSKLDLWFYKVGGELGWLSTRIILTFFFTLQLAVYGSKDFAYFIKMIIG